MRLTKLKLAGFKSFVDPTNVSLPGQLVAVVGPNGCGKSNIIDAVRWVLGESKASALRGESMQDVIFNGSTNRKPVSRASVELVFDNSLGRAAGQWSQYAELAVKRVLTRTGDSEYYINNLRVRRKDIQDVFLGTGLGARAYAIIEQGMISRIIEAKPDELRVFLEEAAGITKYKERRRETEGRIADTRENLLRVEDIRQELGSQMERLEGQAEVARRFHAFNDELTQKQQLLWLLRRNDARAEQERLARDIELSQTGLEAQTAALRETEAKLETARDAHYQANDGLHAAQGDLFAVNAEVARLEAEIRHQREARRNLEARLVQLATEREHWAGQGEKLAEEQLRWSELRELAEMRVEQAQAKFEAQQERLPLAEELVARIQDEVNQLRSRIATAEQRLQVEQTNRAHAQRSLQIIEQRRERLHQEQGGLNAPDEALLDVRLAEIEAVRAEQAEAQERLAEAQQALPEVETRRRAAAAAVQQAVKERAEVQARLTALEQLQKRVQGSGKLGDWLRKHGLDSAPPLWKRLHVQAGWEDAVESVLRERLNAIEAGDVSHVLQWASERPDGKLALLLPGESNTPLAAASAGTGDALSHQVRCDDPRLQAVLNDWLTGMRTAPDLPTALARRGELAPGERFVVASGHVVSAGAVALFATDDAQHGMLERQREIDTLAATLEERQAVVDQVQEQVAELDEQAAELNARIQDLRRQVGDVQNRAHALQMEVLRLEQAVERYRERQSQIADALADLVAEEESERAREMQADDAVTREREALLELQSMMSGVRARLEDAERRLRDERDVVSACERELREVEFSIRECTSKLQEIANQETIARQQLARIDGEQSRCEQEKAATNFEELEPQLQAALETRVAREESLGAQREALSEAETLLRNLEEQRLRIEQSLLPARDRIGDLRLKEQAAQINAEQFQTQLQEAQADEAVLTPLLPGARAGSLQSAIGSLQKGIADLGPVNLAALEELENARERKGFLDAQAEDLGDALNTLESAIRRIDKETRELLQTTFDTVNKHFSELFPTLFGGGRAELVMTGEEILDAGVQVIAQPPGKKNSTIHLLSGGEKALTAISLVFALFQLNPAPFCLLDEVDAPLDDTNTERFCKMVERMSAQTQFLYISHNKITMEMAEQLVGVTMPESGVSRIVEVDIQEALRLREQVTA